MHTCASHLCSMVLCWQMQNLPGFVNLLIRQLSFGACVFRLEFFYVKIGSGSSPAVVPRSLKQWTVTRAVETGDLYASR